MKISELIRDLSCRLVEEGDIEVVHSDGDYDKTKPINYTSIRGIKEDKKVCLKTYWE